MKITFKIFRSFLNVFYKKIPFSNSNIPILLYLIILNSTIYAHIKIRIFISKLEIFLNVIENDEQYDFKWS